MFLSPIVGGYIGGNADLLTDPVASPFWSTEAELGGADRSCGKSSRFHEKFQEVHAHWTLLVVFWDGFGML